VQRGINGVKRPLDPCALGARVTVHPCAEGTQRASSMFPSPDLAMRALLIGVGLMMSLAAPAASLAAQSPVSVGVGAGLAMPFGAMRDEFNPGWRALGTLDVGVPLMPVSLRLDAAYDRFGFKSTPVGSAGAEAGARTIVSGSVSLAFGPRNVLPAISPYAIAGLGMNRTGCTEQDRCETTTQLGWNAGVGMRLGVLALKGFAEARLHWLPGSAFDFSYVPITVGLHF
jgi:hypothetical protein